MNVSVPRELLGRLQNCDSRDLGRMPHYIKAILGELFELAAAPPDASKVELTPIVTACCGDYVNCMKPCTPRGEYLCKSTHHPLVAHSKSEFKRLSALGANVVGPEGDTPRTDGLIECEGDEPMESEDARNWQEERYIAMRSMARQLESECSDIYERCARVCEGLMPEDKYARWHYSGDSNYSGSVSSPNDCAAAIRAAAKERG